MPTRRVFFGTSALALSAAQATAGHSAAGAAGPYDFAAIEQRLGSAFAHRQAFASDRLADGAAASFMVNALNAYEFDYAEGPGTLHVLGIFYGTSVAILLDDVMWQKYQIALVQQRRGDPARQHAQKGANPYGAATSTLDPSAERSDLHGLYHDRSLTALVKRRASLFACDNALRGLATDIAVAYGTSDASPQTVLTDLRAHLLPGALLVPAGVAAVNQAQEMKFTFFPVSV